MLVKILAFLAVFGTVVFIHELGHFIVAKMNDIEVREFMMGFGPKLFKFRKGETEYSIRLIPLGGAVVMVGEDEAVDSPRSFSNKPVLARIAVIFAGPLMNYILALVVFTAIFMSSGISSNTITDLQANMPGAEAGLAQGDKVLSIDGKKIESWENIVTAISNSNGNEMNFNVLRGSEESNIKVTPVFDKTENRYLLGISSREKSLFKAVPAAFNKIVGISHQTLTFLPSLFKQPERVKEVSGPIGIAVIVGEVTEMGLTPLLALVAVISVSLGIFNLLPVPPLDGGKIFIYLIEMIIRKPVNKKFELAVSMLGLGLVLTLFVFVMYNDITKLLA